MSLYEALCGCRYTSQVVWFKVTVANLIGVNSFHDAMEKVQLIKDRLKTFQSLKKSYANVTRRELEFKVNKWVL